VILVDAGLVAVAERLRCRTVFTLDRRDFALYRPKGIRSIEILP
jgi:predicted nucleic acid-binding protein